MSPGFPTRRAAAAVGILAAYSWAATSSVVASDPDPIVATYQACLGRPPATQHAVDYWRRHPDPATGICTSPEATARNEARGLAWFSSSTWMPEVMVDVRRCESSGNYRAKNPRSTASGAYGFLDSTWTSVTGLAPPASDWPREVQDRAAAQLLTNVAGDPGHTGAWAASERCWR